MRVIGAPVDNEYDFESERLFKLYMQLSQSLDEKRDAFFIAINRYD